MSSIRVSTIAQAWYKWKALRLPWRKRYLVGESCIPHASQVSLTNNIPGFDLNGNTYWEFRLTSEPTSRWRRIVKYPSNTHLSSVKVSPLWHQWLRYTRDNAPTLEEQQGDVVRQARMKQLAAAADARWEAKPRMMDAPGEQRLPVLESATIRPDQSAVKEKPDPWAQHRAAQGASEKWQPESWTPSPRK